MPYIQILKTIFDKLWQKKKSDPQITTAPGAAARFITSYTETGL